MSRSWTHWTDYPDWDVTRARERLFRGDVSNLSKPLLDGGSA